MACLTVNVTPIETAVLTVGTVAAASMQVAPMPPAVLTVLPVSTPSVAVAPVGQASLDVSAVGQAVLTVGEVCTVAAGTLVVLAAADGPLRTKTGGYILLNPATNPPE